MTPEQREFYEKLGDALTEVREDLEDNPEYMTDFDYDLIRVTKAAQKLHDLWPTLCEFNKLGEWYDEAFITYAADIRPIISKAVGGGDE